jgi:hypothetical protein
LNRVERKQVVLAGLKEILFLLGCLSEVLLVY